MKGSLFSSRKSGEIGFAELRMANIVFMNLFVDLAG
jgi:hypothetical protein